MENQKQENGREIKNEYLAELKDLVLKAPKGISLSIIAAEDVNTETNQFEGLILAVGSPKRLLSMYQDVFVRVPDLKDIIFDAVAYYKYKEMFDTRSSSTSIFETIFGRSPFGR
ncbi:hypothetical protein [Chryseobacterium arthrosphaerae]|uniref:hypothetical protein n=1 Tax=Chryseobacterium arthrosphaerae TaxID=651561 RepID=UPI00241F35C5|nr:hypothetical protein [Chryseobacterium arthrosphaerae]